MGQYLLLVEIVGENTPHKLTVSCKSLDELRKVLANTFLINYPFTLSLYDNEFDANVTLDRFEQLKFVKKAHGKARIQIQKRRDGSDVKGHSACCIKRAWV